MCVFESSRLIHNGQCLAEHVPRIQLSSATCSRIDIGPCELIDNTRMCLLIILLRQPFFSGVRDFGIPPPQRGGWILTKYRIHVHPPGYISLARYKSPEGHSRFTTDETHQIKIIIIINITQRPLHCLTSFDLNP